MEANKPLGHRSYGSIPHLPGSRTGIGDYHLNEGQAKIATEKVRDEHDKVIIQEKLDGSNVAVAKINGQILAIIRAGYHAHSSPHLQHHLFDKWVARNAGRFNAILNDGERICGEWLAQAHGTIYQLPHEPFVAFDVMKGSTRLPYDAFVTKIQDHFIIPYTVGFGPMNVTDALIKLGQGKHGAIDPVEGLVYRIERNGIVDFLTKYVRPEKQDGKYLSENIWNIEINSFK